MTVGPKGPLGPAGLMEPTSPVGPGRPSAPGELFVPGRGGLKWTKYKYQNAIIILLIMYN